MTSRRRPWLAALLSFLAPGIGQLYAGRWRRALVIIVFQPPVALALSLPAVLLSTSVLNLVVPTLLVLALWALVSVDAWRCARNAASVDKTPMYGRWYSCLAAMFLLTPAIGPAWGRLYGTSFVGSYRVTRPSMEGTILEDESVLAIKWAFGWRDPILGRPLGRTQEPRRLDLLFFRYPGDRSRTFVSRLIGLPGESVEIRRRVVYVEGKALDEPYASFLMDLHVLPTDALEKELSDGPRNTWGPQTVAPNTYFVLGDNRDNSEDSRYWGFVPRADLLGRGVVVYWSQDPEAGLPRWERIGKRLQ